MEHANLARVAAYEVPAGIGTWLEQMARPAYLRAEIQNAVTPWIHPAVELMDQIYRQQTAVERMVNTIAQTDALSATQQWMRDFEEVQRRMATITGGVAQAISEACALSRSILDAVHQPWQDFARLHAGVGSFCGGVADILKNYPGLLGPSGLPAMAGTPSVLGLTLAKDVDLTAGYCAWLAEKDNPVDLSSGWASALQASAWRDHFAGLDAVTNIAGFPGPAARPSQSRPDRQEQRKEVDFQTASRLNKLLKDLPPEFLRWWRAANQAAQGENPDKIRHAAASLRMLTNRLIDHLAPQAVVCAWDHPENIRRSQGKAPLRLRLLYIVRRCEAPALAEMVAGTVASGLALATLLNNGVHDDEPPVDAFGLRLLFRRVECTLCDLIEAACIF